MIYDCDSMIQIYFIIIYMYKCVLGNLGVRGKGS